MAGLPSIRTTGLTDFIPAALFLGAYLFPEPFSQGFMRALRGTALLHLLLYWGATWLAATVLVRADGDPAATRRRIIAALVVALLMVLSAGLASAIALLPALALLLTLVVNLWDAAAAGRAALRVERYLGFAVLPCVVVATLASSAIKPWFDHTNRWPELLTAGLVFALLGLVRIVLERRAAAAEA